MKLFVLAAREMAEQKLAWVAAVFVALGTVGLPYVKGLALSGRDAGIAAVALHLGFVLAISAVLGAATIPADLGGRRLGFYLARPVSMGTLLAGRLLGVWLLVLGGGGVVLLPHLALNVHNLGEWAGLLGFGGVLSLYVLLLGHHLGIAWRSRSPWILLDLGALGAFAWVVGQLMRRLVASGVFRAVPWLLAGGALLVLGALAAAAYFGLEQGRGELQRSQRVAGRVLAGALAVIALAGWGFTKWAVSDSAAALDTFNVAALAPRGEWMALQGGGRFGRPRSLVLNAGTGAMAKAPWWGCFSGDGRHYQWVARQDGDLCLFELDLDGTAVHRAPRRLAPMGKDDYMELKAVSEDGRLSAIRHGGRLLVADRDTRRVQAIPREAGDFYGARMEFLPEGGLREYAPTLAEGTVIREFDLGSGRWTATGRIQEKGWRLYDQAHGQLLVLQRPGLLLCDARTGVLKATIRPQAGERLGVPAFRGDGSFAVVETRGSENLLRVVDAGGRETWTHAVAGSAYTYLAPEPGTGRILLGHSMEAPPCAFHGATEVADPSAGTVLHEAGASLPPPRMTVMQWNDALASRLRMADGGGLLLSRKDRAPRIVLRKARWSWNPPT